MKTLCLIGMILSILFSLVVAEPSFNGNSPGCSGSGCHSLNSNDVNYTLAGNLDVEVTLTGVQPGRRVGGELVDMNGTVVDVVNSTNSNPFILTAPAAGTYLINAGYKNPSRRWDSVSVDISLTSIKSSNELKESLKSFELYQNYPNPFNPVTTINFDLLKSSNVTLTIYTVLGEEIVTLVSERLSTGSYSYNWDAGDFPSGVYLYRLQTGKYVEMRKMVLMK